MTASVTLHSFESRCHELPQTSQTAVWKSHTSTPYCSDILFILVILAKMKTSFKYDGAYEYRLNLRSGSFHTFSHIERVSFLPVDLCRVTLRNSFLPLPLPRLTVFRFPSEFELPEFYCISRPKNDFSNVTVAMKKKTEFSLVCV